MSIQIETISPPEYSAKFAEALTALSPEDQTYLKLVVAVMVDVMHQKKGTAVFMYDLEGDGRAAIAAVGNTTNLPALLYAAKATADELFMNPKGALLQ